MRILMLSWEYPPRIIGGIARHVFDLANAQARAGVEVHVITCEYQGAPEIEESENLTIHRVPAGEDDSDFMAWVKRLNHSTEAKAEELIAKYGTKDMLIHVHDWLGAWAAKDLKHRHKIPLIATIHATEHGRNYGIHSDLQREISQVEWELTYESWWVIVCSHFMKNEVARVLSVPPEKMDVIFNGVDVSKFDIDFDEAEFKSRFAANDESIIFFVGRMAREKGAHVLIEAFRKILDAGQNAKLVIAGGGDRSELKQQAAELGLLDKVYFPGYIDDDTLLKLYKSVDVAVFPSLYEPFGIVALEAMAARTPVVISDAGGLREVVDHGVNGFVTWAGNADSLAWGIMQVLTNPAGAKSMADNAYAKAIDVFNWDRIAAQTIAVYERIRTEIEAGTWK